MKVVIQRVKKANVKVDNIVKGKINYGMMILVGFSIEDEEKNIDKMIKKITSLRIFDDENKVMNKSIIDIQGEILSISQFTLLADTKKGTRPDYKKAMKRNESIKLYDSFNEKLKKEVKILETGVFGAEMEIEMTNDGPITIILEN